LNDHPNAEDAVPGPLGGIRVLDISTVYAAPITAMLLGDFGADVIKVEHPRGDPARSHGANKNGHGLWWKVISRNKRCVTLNLGTPEGQQIFRALHAMPTCSSRTSGPVCWRGGGWARSGSTRSTRV
jgi:crotonobetainyl-CoA:carnitine CoA-transferase CaiB-like acyl-CoA transferase